MSWVKVPELGLTFRDSSPIVEMCAMARGNPLSGSALIATLTEFAHATVNSEDNRPDEDVEAEIAAGCERLQYRPVEARHAATEATSAIRAALKL